MRKLYTGLAWTVAGAVVVQAAAIAFAFGGMLNLVSEGGVVDKALLESFQAGGVGELGFMIHGVVGAGLIPCSHSRCSWSRSSCECAGPGCGRRSSSVSSSCR